MGDRGVRGTQRRLCLRQQPGLRVRFLPGPPSRLLLLAESGRRDSTRRNTGAGVLSGGTTPGSHCGERIEDEAGVLWPFAFRFPNIGDELLRGLRIGVITKLLDRFAVPRRMSGASEQVDWFPGAAMLRVSVIEQLGGMDESYFLYYEETDFCLGLVRNGWTNWYVPSSRVIHATGQSTGVTVAGNEAARLPKYWFESRRRYFVKNHGALYAVATDVVAYFCAQHRPSPTLPARQGLPAAQALRAIAWRQQQPDARRPRCRRRQRRADAHALSGFPTRRPGTAGSYGISTGWRCARTQSVKRRSPSGIVQGKPVLK